MLWKFLKKSGAALRGNAEKKGREDLPAEQERRGNSRPDKIRSDKMILSERLQIERKQFFFDFKENASGRFLRITEEVGSHRAAIIVPATGLQDFRASLDNIIAAGSKA